MMGAFFASLRKNEKGIALMLVSSICVCIGQLLWKRAHTEGVLFLGSGFLFYGAGAVFMLIAYRFGSLSVLQPVLSMNYVFSLFLGSAFLQEDITALKVIGTLIVMCGVGLIAGGDE